MGCIKDNITTWFPGNFDFSRLFDVLPDTIDVKDLPKQKLFTLPATAPAGFYSSTHNEFHVRQDYMRKSTSLNYGFRYDPEDLDTTYGNIPELPKVFANINIQNISNARMQDLVIESWDPESQNIKRIKDIKIESNHTRISQPILKVVNGGAKIPHRIYIPSLKLNKVLDFSSVKLLVNGDLIVPHKRILSESEINQIKEEIHARNIQRKVILPKPFAKRTGTMTESGHFAMIIPFNLDHQNTRDVRFSSNKKLYPNLYMIPTVELTETGIVIYHSKMTGDQYKHFLDDLSSASQLEITYDHLNAENGWVALGDYRDKQSDKNLIKAENTFHNGLIPKLISSAQEVKKGMQMLNPNNVTYKFKTLNEVQTAKLESVVATFPRELQLKIKDWKQRISKYQVVKAGEFNTESEKVEYVAIKPEGEEEVLQVMREVREYLKIAALYGNNDPLNANLSRSSPEKNLASIATAVSEQEPLTSFPANYLNAFIIYYLNPNNETQLLAFNKAKIAVMWVNK